MLAQIAGDVYTIERIGELPSLIAKNAEIFTQLRDARFEPLLERIGNARIVLMGEASHGTSECGRGLRSG